MLSHIIGNNLSKKLRSASVIGKDNGLLGHLVTSDICDSTQLVNIRVTQNNAGIGVATMPIYTVPANNIFVIEAIEYHFGTGQASWIDYRVRVGVNPYIISIGAPGGPNIGISVAMWVYRNPDDIIDMQGNVTVAPCIFEI